MRIAGLLAKHGKPTEIQRKGERDKKNPYDKGEFKKINEVVAIVDELVTGSPAGFKQDRIVNSTDAIMYCSVIDVRAGDKVIQDGKEYRVTKASNPYNSNDHIEVALNVWS
ncbi:hypothetical protein P9Z80_27025 [Bacillus cereus]|nr:hypothetical protein [Bacillus cereus]MEB8668821.1 hypothetical protein [Bacillus cereus]MEC3020888.1 hypothetical protein [Bacillus cereus]MEC3260274.1 hypothetical protein [Bacillus cereus]HDR7453432.1 hypothetical protein [Bacillus cereus]